MDIKTANRYLRGYCKFLMLFSLILIVALSIVSVKLIKISDELKVALQPESKIENVRNLIPIEEKVTDYKLEPLPELPKI